ncbi:MAG: HK97 gp10 family phage protein [Lactobacillaceae bacterium]|jgi:hypothetical protein|nr:HK97 gp10 family phage protein [Lactobacillaceae bacterium]
MIEADLSDGITKYLSEYTDEVVEALDKTKQNVAKEAVQKLKQGGSYKDRTGKYTKGWKVTHQGTTYTVWNSKQWYLTHLLENGHATRNGKRTKAYPHIAVIDEWVAEEMVKRTEEALKK